MVNIQGKPLSARRANVALELMQQQGALDTVLGGAGGPEAAGAGVAAAPAQDAPTGPCVVRLQHMVSRDDLQDPDEYKDLVEEVGLPITLTWLSSLITLEWQLCAVHQQGQKTQRTSRHGLY